MELRCFRGLKPRQRVDELAESNAKSPLDCMYVGIPKGNDHGGHLWTGWFGSRPSLARPNALAS